MNSSIVEQIITIARKLELTIATCESITGGMVASYLTSVDGSSQAFKMGVVTYSNESKIKLVNVNRQTIDKFGAISSQTAKEMAIGLFKLSKCDICVSVTGNASVNNPMENMPSGKSYICIVVFDLAYEYEFTSKANNRNDIRLETVFFIFNTMLSILKELKK